MAESTTPPLSKMESLTGDSLEAVSREEMASNPFLFLQMIKMLLLWKSCRQLSKLSITNLDIQSYNRSTSAGRKPLNMRMESYMDPGPFSQAWKSLAMRLNHTT